MVISQKCKLNKVLDYKKVIEYTVIKFILFYIGHITYTLELFKIIEHKNI